MNNRRLSGFVLITSCLVLVIFGYIFTPPNLYQERDIGIRMNIVEQYRSQFNIAQIATAVGGVGMAAGYLLLSLYLRRDETARLASIGAVFMFLGAVSLAILMLGGVLDPRAYLERDSVQGSALSIFFQGYAWLTILGYVLYGLVFLRSDFPRWLAYLTLGYTTVILIVALLVSTFAVEFLFLLPLVIGIVLSLRPKGKLEVAAA
jgi:hypothetical protein